MHQQPRSSLKTDSLMLLFAAILFACAVRGWLANSEISAALWPSDINASFVKLLGGTSDADAVGKTVFELGAVSVFVRIAAILGMLSLLAIGAGRASSTAVIRKTALVLSVSSLWWVIWLCGDLGFRPLAALAMGLLPLWITATAGSVFWMWWNAFAESQRAAVPPTFVGSHSKKPLGLLCSGIVAWVAVSFWMNACLYQQLFIPHGDSAMYEEHLWNVWHGKGFRSYLDQGLFLGEHVQVIHLLLLPLHMLWSSHLLLELTESIALASCAIPIYRLTRRKTGDQWAAALMGLAWLLYFPMHFLDIAIDQKTFRPIALGLPFLFWLIEFVEIKKYKSALACLILALSAKEDIALVTFPLLAVLAMQTWQTRDPKGNRSSAAWPSVMAIGSVVYLLAVVLVVIPWFREGEVVHYSRYFGDLGSSPTELVKTAISSPSKVFAQAFTIQTLLYCCVFLVPLAFVPLRRPLCLAAGAISFGMLSLLQFGDASGLPPVPYHHFHAPLLVVVFWAAISGLTKAGAAAEALPKSSATRWNMDFNSPRKMAGLILCLCAATGFTGSLMPVGVTFWSKDSGFGYQRLYLPTDTQQLERAAMADKVVAQIPATARVAATDFIHTRLTHRERSYDYSNYLRKVNDYQTGVPSDTDFIVIDTRHKYSEYRSPNDVPELKQPDTWELLPDTTNGAFLVLKRKAE